MKSLIILMWTVSQLSSAQRVYDMEFICGQDLTIFDFDIVLNGKASYSPKTMPSECIVVLEAGYTDSDYRLEVIIEAIQIQDCSTYLDIFNERQASGNYLRRLGCTSMSTDTIYSDKQWVTLRLSRPRNLPQTAYIFTLKIKAYKESDRAATAGSDLPVGAIVGIILGLLTLIVVAVILVWCWRSGRIMEYVGSGQDTEDLEEKSVASLGVDNNSIWNSEPIDKNDPNAFRRSDGPQYLGRRSIRDMKPRYEDGSEFGDYISTTSAQNARLAAIPTENNHEHSGPQIKNTNEVQMNVRKGESSAAWKRDDSDLRNALNAEIRRGPRVPETDTSTKNRISSDIEEKGQARDGWQKEQTSLKNLLNAEIRRRSSNGGQSATPKNSQETLIDEVFESDDNKIEVPLHAKRNGQNVESSPRGHHSRSTKRDKDNHEEGHMKRHDDSPSRKPRNHGESPSRGSRHGESPSRSPRRSRHGESPSRDELQRGTEARDSNRSTSSQKDNQKRAKSLAQEASEARLKSRNRGNQVDPPSDFDSSSFMSVPEPVTVTASVHPDTKTKSKHHKDSRSQDMDSNDLEVREITQKSKNIDPDLMVNPNHSKSQKSPKNKKKKRKSKSKDRDEDVLPPEAFEPLFDRPVSEEPLPDGMQPLNTAYNNPYGMYPGMYPMSNYGMPYGMMPGQGAVPPGTQTYAYAYQGIPTGPGMPPSQAAYIVQQSPSKNGPVQKTFMMASTESRPQSQDGYNRGTDYPGHPARSSTPHSVASYGDTPHGHQRSYPKNSSVVPKGRSQPEGHRTTVMKSGVDPRTGIETHQALWTDNTRDSTDPTSEHNPKLDRRTVTRTTTRSGYGDLPEDTDNITNHLYIQLDPDDPAFLAPSNTGTHALSSTETPEGDNVNYYLALNNKHGSPQHIIHPAPSRHKAIRDSVSIA
ncbi:hypothetical protein LOTGIDRAFT_238342 [Lottia gigantea]|uniref:CUB domain-containing protein n=1 Tax=Lottia gigantea TaxID=225164 RepID=V4B578_LOTGI|nr:hypothetical protein LOTGIDRAFT_238342 [Lottia gigantea]ESP01137.1 hypothetical protein LOTGIDRAFT_238342 [Lottia gigantea]